jgi:hypothetical protein
VPWTARSLGRAGRRGGSPEPLVGSAAKVAAWAARRSDLGAHAHGRRQLSSASVSAPVGAPSLWCLGSVRGGLRWARLVPGLVHLISSSRGAGDGDGARLAPRSGGGGSCAVVVLRMCRRCVGQRSAVRQRCDVCHHCSGESGYEGWFCSGESLTVRRLWMSLSSLGGGHR